MIKHGRTIAGEVWITTDGRAYFVQLHEDDIVDYEPDVHQDSEGEPVSTTVMCFSQIRNPTSIKAPPTIASKPHQRFGWQGTCIHDFTIPKWAQKQRHVDISEVPSTPIYQEPKRATAVAINTRFSIFAIGTYGYFFRNCSLFHLDVEK